MSSLKVFASQDDMLAGQMNTTDYVDPYITRMDQKVCI